MLKRSVKAALAVIMLLVCAHPALAGVAGSFTAVEGRVDILKSGEKRATPVKAGAPVSEGDIVRTKSGAYAEITFSDDTVLRLAESTRVEVREYLLNGNKRENGALRLLRGKVRATVSKGLGRVIPVIYSGPTTFKIETPTAVAGVKGTDFFIFHTLGMTGVFVLEGAVDTIAKDAPEYVSRVRGGEYSIVEQARPATAPASARDFVMSRHLRDASPGESARERHHGEDRDGRDRKELFEGGRARVERTDEAKGRSRGYDDFDGKDFRDYERLSEYDGDRLDVAVYEGDHHDHDHDRPISETNTALLSNAFKGTMASGAADIVSMSSVVDGRFRDDHTWWADIDGMFSNGGARTTFTGTMSGTTDKGPFSGTITNGSWETGTWSAEVAGTLPGGTFTGTLSGTHDTAASGSLNGSGSGTWTPTN